MNHKLFFIGLSVFITGSGILALGFSEKVQEKTHAIISSFSSQNNERELIQQNTMQQPEETSIRVKPSFTLYYDFTCPHCNSFFENTFIPLSTKYKADFNFTVLPYSLSQSEESIEQAKNFFCASTIKDSVQVVQEMNTLTEFNNNIDEENGDQTKKTLLQALNFNLEQSGNFVSCITNTPELEKNLAEIKQSAREKGVRGTPTFFIAEKKFEKNQSIKKVEFEIVDILSQ